MVFVEMQTGRSTPIVILFFPTISVMAQTSLIFSSPGEIVSQDGFVCADTSENINKQKKKT